MICSAGMVGFFRHSLKFRFLLYAIPAVGLLGVVIVLAYNHVLVGVEENLGRRFVEKHVLYDESRAVGPLAREIALAKSLVKSPAIIAWASDEEDTAKKRRAIAQLESYRTIFKDGSYFFVIDGSGNYYFNDKTNTYAGRQLRYTIKPDDPKDAWYAATKQLGEACAVNIDYDSELDVTKVWINCLVHSGARIVGIIGTGIDLTGFVRAIVGYDEAGIDKVYVNRDGAIQAHADISKIDFRSLTKSDALRKTIFQLLDSEEDAARVRDVMDFLAETPHAVKSLFVDIGGKRNLLGMTYLEDIGWYDVTVLDFKTLIVGDRLTGLMTLVVLAVLTTLLVIGWIINRTVLDPVANLDASVEEMKSGNYSVALDQSTRDEIGRLSRNFTEMADAVRTNTEELERRVLERTAELNEAKKQAESANEAKSDFLANMSHELRTPMNAVIGFSDILEDETAGPLNERQAHYVRNISASGEHLLNLINSVLDLSKIEAGKLMTEPKQVNVGDIIGLCLQLISAKAHQGGVKLAADVSKDLPSLYVDERMLTQMLVNLLSNAVKFTAEDGTVTVGAEVSGGDRLSISVTDTGVGMSADEIPIALAAFEQTENGKFKEGTGLGLPLVKRMAALNNGTLEIESQPGRGTTATITFPLA